MARNKKQTASAAPTTWSVADFGAFYTEHAAELRAHAARILKDTQRAEEVVQDALIKFMLAAPELESSDHALGYLHRTIENLCVDIFRLEGRRPNLVLLDEATSEVEATWVDEGDHSEVIAQADDAAIIRQALAMLSPAERTALVMWEMDGRTTEEIAAELNIKESAVRHTISRARASMRRVLTEIIIDEDRGLTALDMLSTTYKRAGEFAKKSSRVALSLVLVLAAFLGFNSLTGNEGMGGSSRVVAEAPLNPATPALGNNNSNSNENSTNNSTTATPSPSSSATTQAAETDAATETSTAQDDAAIEEAASIDLRATTKKFSSSIAAAKETLALAGPATFPGVGANGLPTGFTINDGGDYAGAAVLKNFGDPSFVGMKTITESIFATNDPKNVNIILDQFVTFTGTALQYSVVPTVRINGVWQDLLVVSTNTRVETQADGTKLIIATMFIDPSKTGSNNIKAPAGGRDADKIPAIVTVRLHVTPLGQTILGQAVQVLDPFTSAGGAF
jgi:RNA polymerase sigma factor (sigma-70 family)